MPHARPGQPARVVDFQKVDESLSPDAGEITPLSLVDPLIHPPPAAVARRVLKLALACQDNSGGKNRPPLAPGTQHRKPDIVTTVREVLDQLES